MFTSEYTVGLIVHIYILTRRVEITINLTHFTHTFIIFEVTYIIGLGGFIMVIPQVFIKHNPVIFLNGFVLFVA